MNDGVQKEPLSDVSLQAVDKLISAYERDSAQSANFYYQVCQNYVDGGLRKDVLSSSFQKISSEDEISYLSSNLRSLSNIPSKTDTNLELKSAYADFLRDTLGKKLAYHGAFLKDPEPLDIFNADPEAGFTRKSDFEDFIDLQVEREHEAVFRYGRAIMEIAAGNETFAQNIVAMDTAKITPLLSDFDQDPAHEFGYLKRFSEHLPVSGVLEKFDHLASLHDAENNLHEIIFQNSAIHPFHEMLDQKFDGFNAEVERKSLSSADVDRLSVSPAKRLDDVDLQKPAVLDRLNDMPFGNFLRKTIFLKTERDWERKVSAVAEQSFRADLSSIEKQSHNEAFSQSKIYLISKISSPKIERFHPDVLGSQLELERTRNLIRLSQTIEKNTLVVLLNKLPENAISLSSKVVLDDIALKDKEKSKGKNVVAFREI